MKTILRNALLMLFLVPAFQALTAQSLIINGYVNNLSNVPIAGKQVHIMIDSTMGPVLPFSYTGVTTTMSNGYYVDTVALPVGVTSAMVYCWVLDCVQQAQYSFQWYSAPGPLPLMNFSICDSAISTNCNSNFLVAQNPNALSVSFTDQSSPSTGSSITSWLWSFGDSTISTQQSPTHVYAAPGTYMVCLTITDGLICNSTSCQQIIVSNSIPGGCTAGYIANPVGGTTAVSFTNTSSNLYMPAIYTVYYLWNFGDGILDSTNNMNPITHIYAQPGTYNACVAIYVTDIVTNTVVCQNSWCSTITAGGTPQPNGFIYGMLYANNMAAGSSVVYLIEHNTLLGTLTAVDTTYSIDSSGVTSYYFSNITPGNYLVKAALLPANPNYANYMPTYHLSSLYWSTATSASVSANTFTQVPINFIAGTNPGGPGFIGGLISQGANKGPGDPIEGVQVMLLDVNNADKPVAFTFTNATGIFNFTNIPYGTFKVYAEMLNKTTNPVIVTIDATTPSTDGIKIVVGSQVISFIQDLPVMDAASVGAAYPNPAKEECFLPLTLNQAATLQLQIADLTGKTLRTNDRILQAGQQVLQIDTRSLSQGIYLLSLSTPDGMKITRKLVIQ